ncbi:MAG TPA: WecB/TagA/CpsF family glycosyltransferase [Candidatus Gastranaerophilales bacterium]|nr:WecB/TagA/CpsF family glycosyltransferase [Candidatus Gastranaerophilales bacterium]
MRQILKKKVKRACIFNYPVDITSRENAVNFVLECMQNKQGLHVVTINPEIIYAADKNSELAKIIKQAEFIIPDSVGMMLAIKSLGFMNADQIPGIEFSENLIEKCSKKGYKVAFLGGSEDTINALIEEFDAKYPELDVVFSQNGYFNCGETENIINKLKNTEPDLLLVALGAPKQEYFISNAKKHLDKTVMIGVGGSFDVWAKKTKRAPVLFRLFGLEWFYRLITQPQRFNRMFPVLPLFFLRILFERANLRKEY